MGEPTFLLYRRCGIPDHALPDDFCDCGHRVRTHAPDPTGGGACGMCETPTSPSIPAGIYAVSAPVGVRMTVAALTTSMTREQARGLATYLTQLADRGDTSG